MYVLISTDAVAFSNAHFGAGIGAIHLDNVGCTGSENNLIDCPRSFIVSCTYGHSEDAGVRCQGLENDVELQQYLSRHYHVYKVKQNIKCLSKIFLF